MKNNTPLYMTVYNEIKTKIIDRTIQPNTKVDSVRSYAVKRGISTTTVERAYNQLVIEGYVVSKPKSGFIVNDIHGKNEPSFSMVDPIETKQHRNNQLTSDLFDIKTYKSVMNKVINYYSDDLYTACDPQGEIELREEILKHVQAERNINCDVNQIIIGPGIQFLLSILLYLHKRKSVLYLEPAFQKAIDIFKFNGYSFSGKDSISDIVSSQGDYLYISPSNIYPTGDVIKVSERYDLLEWAKKNNTYIIEDDYNFFIRYNSYTIPSIKSLDNNKNVVYMGSFSKSLLPSIRISYMILPIPLYNIYKDIHTSFSQGVSKLEQLTLALYMKEGLFKRHTKKLYSLYKEKNEVITSFLDENNINYRGTDSNLHVILDFKNSDEMTNFCDNCDKQQLQYDCFDTSVIFPYSGLEIIEIPKLLGKLFK